MLYASLLVLAAAVAAPPADQDLPPLSETLPAEADAAEAADVTDPFGAPEATPDIVQPRSRVTRPATRLAEARVSRPPIEAPPEYPLSNLPFIQGGFGQLSLQLTGLDGSFLLMRQLTADVRHGAFAFGATLQYGDTAELSYTVGGANVHWKFATYELLDFTAGMMLGIGAASRPVAGGSTALFAWQPEAGVHARLATWLRASASLGWRLVNAGDWAGPAGDELSGFVMGIGIGFGSFVGP